MNKETAQEILNLLTKAGYKNTAQDDFSMDFISKDEIHIVKVSQTTVTFQHKTNSEISYSFGANVKAVKDFLRDPKSFDEEAYVKAVEEAKEEKKPSKEKAAPKEKAPKVEKVKAEKPVKESKVRAPKAEKAAKPAKEEKAPKELSTRGVMIAMMKEGKTKEEIFAHLLTLNTGRDDKSLRNQLSLNWSQFHKDSKPAEASKPAEVKAEDKKEEVPAKEEQKAA